MTLSGTHSSSFTAAWTVADDNLVLTVGTPISEGTAVEVIVDATNAIKLPTAGINPNSHSLTISTTWVSYCSLPVYSWRIATGDNKETKRSEANTKTVDDQMFHHLLPHPLHLLYPQSHTPKQTTDPAAMCSR